ncbi:MAG: sporulation protein [Bacilli bacterium]
MGLFNKFLAKIGVGAATVDARLERDTYELGDTVRGIVVVSGGNVPQDIHFINLSVTTFCIEERDDKKVEVPYRLNAVALTDRFTIQPGEHREFPFEFTLPYATPVSLQRKSVWIDTDLGIENAVDSSDIDFITVRGSRFTSGVLAEIERLGFTLRKVENVRAPHSLRDLTPVVQEYEFKPVTGPYLSKLDELELSMVCLDTDRMVLFLEIDRRASSLSGLFAELLEVDETHVQIELTESDIPRLREIIDQYV